MSEPIKRSPYRGVPKSQWSEVKAAEAARKVRERLEAAVPPEERGTTPAIPAAAAGVITPTPNAFVAQAPVALQPEPDVPRETIHSRPADAAAIPRNQFNGRMTQLTVVGLNGSDTDPIPGYQLYWFNDVNDTKVRIEQARASGWEHVKKEEVAFYHGGSNEDLGSNVRKVVGPNSVPPTYAYLMKKPNWLYEAHMAEREVLHGRIENEIRKGVYNAKPEDRRYTASDMPGSSLPKIEISSNLNR